MITLHLIGEQLTPYLIKAASGWRCLKDMAVTPFDRTTKIEYATVAEAIDDHPSLKDDSELMEWLIQNGEL